MLRVLVIDDDPFSSRLVTAMLQPQPGRPAEFLVSACGTAAEGLQQLLAGGHDVYLIDQHLDQGRTGFDLLRQARARGVWQPLVLLTASDDPTMDIQALRLGATDYLQKCELGRPLLTRVLRFAHERAHVTHRALREQRLRSVGMLASGIAHQFSNLHAVALGNAQLVLRSKDLPAKAAERLQAVVTVIESANSITQTLRACTAEPQRRRCHVVELARRAVELAASAPIDRRIIACVDERARPEIDGDPGQIVECLLQLLGNAQHAMRESATRQITVTVDATSDCAVLRVTDNGIGMSATVREQLFQPFFTTKDPFAPRGLDGDGGSGLGLYLCDQVLRDHGGTVHVQSQPEAGTTAELCFPRLPPAAKATPRAALVIDDDASVRELLHDLLTDLGWTVTLCSGAAEALAAVARQHFSVALCDWRLPGCDTAALIRDLTDLSGGRLPLLVVSGDEVIVHHLPGVLGVLPKPFALAQLEALLLSHCPV